MFIELLRTEHAFFVFGKQKKHRGILILNNFYKQNIALSSISTVNYSPHFFPFIFSSTTGHKVVAWNNWIKKLIWNFPTFAVTCCVHIFLHFTVTELIKTFSRKWFLQQMLNSVYCSVQFSDMHKECLCECMFKPKEREKCFSDFHLFTPGAYSLLIGACTKCRLKFSTLIKYFRSLIKNHNSLARCLISWIINGYGKLF